jgi:hypothetical protein
MPRSRRFSIPLLVVSILLTAAGFAAAQEPSRFTLGGTTYTKWLWGNQRDEGSLYNFTTVPGEGYGDNGQGSEVELLLNARISKQVLVTGRIHSRFSQNFWTNFGGFGGRNPAFEDPPGAPCTSGDCGEFDPRSNQYIKLRGVAVVLTPGYRWLDSATIGNNDFGQFDPFVVGRFRYIDRDNAAGILLQGSTTGRKVTWDAARISLPRLFAGPNFSTGDYHSADATYVGQVKWTAGPMFDVGGIFEYVNDIEIDPRDRDIDDGRDLRFRFKNMVTGVKVGVHVSPNVDVRGNLYYSDAKSNKDIVDDIGFSLSGFSPVPLGKHNDITWRANLDLNDPFGMGLSFNLEAFSIGAEYVSMLAARREADVLLTEGHDATFAFPGPSNAAFGVFGGNPTRIGYGGWDGNAVQVATINVDNEFSDFDEPMAETAIGWQGVTVAPLFVTGALELGGEFTYLTYDTNWQAWDRPDQPILQTVFPGMELDSGPGHSFRSAYTPFRDKTENIVVLRAKYVLDVGKGIDVFGKVKHISDKDDRLNDERFLPFQAGDCPGGGVACANNRRFYSPGNSTADVYGNPPVITVGGVTGYQWKPFDSISDDNRDLDSLSFRLGAGYQLTDDLYSSLTFAHYNVDLEDGNTAFQAYNLHELASGEHKKNQLIANARYVLAGVEIGFEYQYNFGTFSPDFGDGFVVQFANDDISRNNNVPVGSPGFSNRFGGWNSLRERDFEHHRLKAFMKAQF